MPTDSTIGSLHEPSAIRALTVDDVTLTYVVDGAMMMDRAAFFPAIPETYWAAHPAALDGDGRVVMAAGGVLVQRAGHTLLVDAGYGPADATSALGRVDTGRLPAALAALGVAPDDVDVLAFTHLHVDHTGWAFQPGSAGATPVFPRAAYRVCAAELAAVRGAEPDLGTPPLTDVLEPLLRRAEPFADGDQVAPGVTAVVTPGHSGGHTSYVVTTASGRRVVLFGDAFHIPAQVTEPRWPSRPDADPAAVPAARDRIFAELGHPDTLGIGVHFGDQVFGRVDGDAHGNRWWAPVPAPVVG